MLTRNYWNIKSIYVKLLHLIESSILRLNPIIYIFYYSENCYLNYFINRKAHNQITFSIEYKNAVSKQSIEMQTQNPSHHLFCLKNVCSCRKLHLTLRSRNLALFRCTQIIIALLWINDKQKSNFTFNFKQLIPWFMKCNYNSCYL